MPLAWDCYEIGWVVRSGPRSMPQALWTRQRKELSLNFIWVGTTLNSICKGMGLFGKGFQTIVFSV